MFPELFKIGRFSLPSYGFIIASGVLVGLLLGVRNSRRQGIDPDKTWDLGIFVLLSGVVGAKVLYVINDWRAYAEHPREIFSLDMLRVGGVFSGGLITAMLATIWCVRKNQMSLLATCDVLAPGLALAHAVGRVGCFAAGCCYGKPTKHFWGVTFTNPIAHLNSGTPLSVPLEPTQLFEAAVELANCLILMRLLKNKKFDGQIIGGYFLFYGLARYFLEYLRDDPGRGSAFGGVMTGTQLVSILLVLAGTSLWTLRLPNTASATMARDRIF